MGIIGASMPPGAIAANHVFLLDAVLRMTNAMPAKHSNRQIGLPMQDVMPYS